MIACTPYPIPGHTLLTAYRHAVYLVCETCHNGLCNVIGMYRTYATHVLIGHCEDRYDTGPNSDLTFFPETTRAYARGAYLVPRRQPSLFRAGVTVFGGMMGRDV